MSAFIKMKGWISLLPSFSFTGVIEIAILAALIYIILLWIKNTKAWQLLKGILIIILFTAFAVFFRLTTIVWLIERLSTAAIIAIVVIFQPELRKALEQLGSRNLISQFRGLDTRQNTHINEELIAACSTMSEHKTGALIVIEQTQSLEEIEKTGIYVDGIVTVALLINIFEKNTPLHDGAVVISHDRVTSATCYLPLSDAEISKAYGTRHRAALGISENSDAITLVVSEETGRISVASEGKLYRIREPEELLKYLPKEEKEGEERKSIFSRIFSKEKKKEQS